MKLSELTVTQELEALHKLRSGTLIGVDDDIRDVIDERIAFLRDFQARQTLGKLLIDELGIEDADDE